MTDNDYGHGDALIGTFDDRTPDTFYGACHNLFISLINKYPNCPVIVVTPLHRDTEDEIHIKGDQPTTLKTYVNIIREVAEFYSLPICDLYATSGIQPCIPVMKEKYMPDGLHPNDEGHKIIARRIADVLTRI